MKNVKEIIKKAASVIGWAVSMIMFTAGTGAAIVGIIAGIAGFVTNRAVYDIIVGYAGCIFMTAGCFAWMTICFFGARDRVPFD